MIAVAAATVTTAGQRSSVRPYFPARGEWQKKDPSAVGLNKAKLDDAIAFAVAHENPNTKDQSVAIVNQFRSEAPFNTLIGPTQPRAGSNGVIIREFECVRDIRRFDAELDSMGSAERERTKERHVHVPAAGSAELIRFCRPKANSAGLGPRARIVVERTT